MAFSSDKLDRQIRKNNFFNLSSDEDDSDAEEEERKKEEEFETKVRKWDWDKEENKDLYFKKNVESIPNKRLKTTNHESGLQSQIDAHIARFRIDKSINLSSGVKYDLLGHQSSVNRIHWCQKYQNKNILLASSMDNKISIWNVNEAYLNKPVKIYKIHSKAIRNAIWSKQETEIVSVSYDQTSVLINTETGKEINRLEYKTILTAIANHPNDEHIVIVGANNEILAWDTRTNKCSQTYKYKSAIGQTQDILFINENEFITCGDIVCKESGENAILVWDYKSTAYISNQIFHEKYIVTCLKKHPLNSLFLAQTHGNYIAEFTTRPPYKMNKHKRFESNGHFTAGYSIGFDLNKNGSIVASGSTDGYVYFYNFHTSKIMKRVNLFNDYVTQPCMDVKFQTVQISDEEKHILAGSSWNGQIKIFEI